MNITNIHQYNDGVIFDIAEYSDIQDVEHWLSKDVPDSLKSAVEIKNKTIYITHPLVTMGFVTNFGHVTEGKVQVPYIVFDVNRKSTFVVDLKSNKQLVYAYYGQSM